MAMYALPLRLLLNGGDRRQLLPEIPIADPCSAAVSPPDFDIRDTCPFTLLQYPE